MNPTSNDSSVSLAGLERIGLPVSRMLGAAIALLSAAAQTATADISTEAQWTTASGGNGHTYRVVATSSLISWDSANAAASAAGGYLATITTSTENDFVFSLINSPAYWKQTLNGHGPWIGGFQPSGATEPSGGWSWVTQTGASNPEDFSFTDWESGEPNNFTTTVGGTTYNQDRIAYFHLGTGRASTWSDEYNLASSSLNQWTISYVIELNAIPEPTSTFLFGLSGLVLLGKRLKRCQFRLL